MAYKIYHKSKSAKSWKYSDGVYKNKANAERYAKALRNKKTHYVQVRNVDKGRKDYWLD